MLSICVSVVKIRKSSVFIFDLKLKRWINCSRTLRKDLIETILLYTLFNIKRTHLIKLLVLITILNQKSFRVNFGKELEDENVLF